MILQVERPKPALGFEFPVPVIKKNTREQVNRTAA